MTYNENLKLKSLLSLGFLVTIDTFTGTETVKEFKDGYPLLVLCESGVAFTCISTPIEKIRVYKEYPDWKSLVGVP